MTVTSTTAPIADARWTPSYARVPTRNKVILADKGTHLKRRALRRCKRSLWFELACLVEQAEFELQCGLRPARPRTVGISDLSVWLKVTHRVDRGPEAFGLHHARLQTDAAARSNPRTARLPSHRVHRGRPRAVVVGPSLHRSRTSCASKLAARRS